MGRPGPGRDDASTARTLRSLIVPIYLPTALQFSGSAAIMPILPIIALRLGFNVAEAAALGLIGGALSVLGTIPIGRLMMRVGERRSLLVSGALLVAVSVVMGLLVDDGLRSGGDLPHRAGLIAALVVMSAGMIVWNLGRQAYLGMHLPPRMRARGMTTLGGAMRVGEIAGPLLSSLVLLVGHPSWVFYLYAALVGTACVCVMIRMLDGDEGPTGAGQVREDTREKARKEGASAPRREPSTVTGMLGRTLRVRDMVVVAAGVIPLAMARTNRPIIVPLMAASLGLSEREVTLIFGIAACIEILLFYPAGVIMDRWGRVAAIVPCMSILAAGFLVATPFTLSSAPGITPSAAFWVLLAGQIVMGIGNGLGSGIMMTLGVDMSNSATRTTDLARWNTLMGAGRLTAPLLVSATTLFAPIGWAAIVSAVLLVAGAGSLMRTLPRYGLGARGARL